MASTETARYHPGKSSKNFSVYAASYDSDLKNKKESSGAFIFQTHFDFAKYEVLYRR